MEKNMNMSVKKESEMDFNNDLAFDLTVSMMRNYAKDCLVDKDMEMMDPMAGSYLLVHNLVVGLLVKAFLHVPDDSEGRIAKELQGQLDILDPKDIAGQIENFLELGVDSTKAALDDIQV